MVENSSPAMPHTLMLDNRRTLSLTGITDVPGFDERTVSLRTDTASLIVKGERLHISKLSLETGDVVIDGEISALQYDVSRSRSVKSRLLR